MYTVVVELLEGVAFQEYSYSGVANLKEAPSGRDLEGNFGPRYGVDPRGIYPISARVEGRETGCGGRNRWDTGR